MCLLRTGPEDELRTVLRALVAEGTFVRELDTSGVAYHSQMLQPVLAELQAGEARTSWPLQIQACDSIKQYS